MMILKEIFDKDFFASLSESLSKFCPNFNESEFLSFVHDDSWDQRELKQRMAHICHSLNKILSSDYKNDVEILKKVASDVDIKSKHSGLSLVIFANYVELFGLDNFEVSMKALEFFTPYGSSEFAVRQFYVRYPKETLGYFLKWSQSADLHVRRLASEGSRSRLPWGIALQNIKKDPNPIIPILESLKDDESEYVRRSVANNLNDISKDNPRVVLDLTQKWLKDACDNRVKLIKHGLRTLLKSSNFEALEMFGYINVKNPIESFDLQNLTINIGQSLNFNIKFQLKELVKIRLEYVIYFLRKDQKFSRKVFQIMKKEFEKGEYSLKKNHSFKEITTRKYYPGKHKIALMVNGLEVDTKEFCLKVKNI
jgi:3-methyladenine DNA glycosylase AlkC